MYCDATFYSKAACKLTSTVRKFTDKEIDKEILVKLLQAAMAAPQNIPLAASGLGLGSVWIGLYPLPSKIKPVRKLLDIPEYVIPLGVVYLGYPDEVREPRTQYNEKVVY